MGVQSRMLRIVSIFALFLASASASDGGIVGGEEAEPHSIPFQVSLRQVDADDWHFCGGSVLGPRHILTAAHCTVIWDSVEVVEDIVMNEYVAAVGLPEQEQQSTGSCTVSGWGTLKSGGSCCPMKLMKVDVPVVEESTCKNEYPFSIAESMICAGEHGKDSCQGDSGGPTLCYNEDGSGYLAGVVSWGIGCGGYFLPGVYTEVSYFVDWIAANMAQNILEGNIL